MGRRHLEFSVGDQVLLKLTPQIWKKISSKSVHRGLIPKYDRPCKDLLDTARQQTQRALPVIRKEFEKTVLKILDLKTMGQSKKNRRTDYLVSLSGESEADATWERDVTLWQFKEKLNEYWAVREVCALGRGIVLAWSNIVMDDQTDGRSGCQAVVCTGRHAAHSGRTGLADARAELGSMAQHSGGRAWQMRKLNSTAWRSTRQQCAGARR
ncbi:hypothetical protein Sango_1053200 [Sesamum angolense]|uniref:Uncharacterized protein n=1 Tax=Sesamum angolense TaxID=2727404 RepID=A0AAE1X0R4_9LAMI|nr:hypothetical protein Sango_1053200 [Sesamum angolense]